MRKGLMKKPLLQKVLFVIKRAVPYKTVKDSDGVELLLGTEKPESYEQEVPTSLFSFVVFNSSCPDTRQWASRFAACLGVENKSFIFDWVGKKDGVCLN